MGIDDWSTDESQNLELDGSDISRRASPGAPANELTRKLMAHVKELEEKIVSDGIAVDGITIENNSGTLTVKDVAIDGDTTDLLTEKITEIEAAATQAGEDATAAQTAATQAAASAASAASAITSAATAANLAAEQADIAARAAARAQSGAAMAESAVQAVVAQTNLNWQKSSTAGAVAIYPVPETVLEPVVNFSFTETGPAQGDKAPDNPSTITGVSSVKVTRCGKNLLPSVAEGTTSSHGITFVVASDGSVSVSGTADANAQLSIPYVDLRPGTYILSGCPSGGSDSSFYLGAQGGRYDTGSGRSFTLTGATRVYFWIQVVSGTVISTPIVFRPQLELGSTATTFEPYEGADYTINLGSTYYGGSIDLATGVMTVTHEMATVSSARYFVSSTDTIVACRCALVGSAGLNFSASVCAELPAEADATETGEYFRKYGSGTYSAWAVVYLLKSRLDFSTATDPTAPTDTEMLTAMSAYLAENPLHFCGPIAIPTTVQLTPTQILSLTQSDKYTPRLNTVYSDQTSVQVGYAKSPMRTEYELTSAIIELGSN